VKETTDNHFSMDGSMGPPLEEETMRWELITKDTKFRVGDLLWNPYYQSVTKLDDEFDIEFLTKQSVFNDTHILKIKPPI